jgi:hypothetical protein
MKFPRWLVVALLSTSLLAVMGYGGWWWVTWPDRTSSQFCELVAERRFADAARVSDSSLAVVLNSCDRNPDMWDVHADIRDTRSLRDVFRGHRTADLFVGMRNSGITLVVTAERGRILLMPLTDE